MPDLDAVLDRLAIEELQARYGDAVTRQAWDELPPMFEDGCPIRLDLRGGRVVEHEGGAAIAAFVASSIERFEFFEFVLLNRVVDVGPAAGEAGDRLYMQELRQDAGTHRWSTAYGLYRDRYRKGDDGTWRFARRDYSTLARTAAGDGGDGLEVFEVPRG